MADDACDQQLASPIFGKLPAELRALLFTELCGGRRVHVEFMTHPTRCDKVSNRRRWRHGVCEDAVSVPFDRVIARSHLCLIPGRWRPLDISLLLTCWRALAEGIPVLYQSNTFFISNSGDRRRPVDDIRSLQAKIPANWSLIRSLEIDWVVTFLFRNCESMVPHLSGRDDYEALWDALAEMPALEQLRVALIMPPYSWVEPTSPSVDLRELYLGPVMRPKGLRLCEVIMPASYRSHFQPREGELFVGSDGSCQYRMLWMGNTTGPAPSDPASTASASRFAAAQLL